jgi:hypothetical protein
LCCHIFKSNIKRLVSDVVISKCALSVQGVLNSQLEFCFLKSFESVCGISLSLKKQDLFLVVLVVELDSLSLGRLDVMEH